MAEQSKIEWTDHTFNPWRGSRVVGSEAYWRKPLKWARDAVQRKPGTIQAPYRPRVFCASLADVFEARPELVEPRARLFELIRKTPELDWLLLTKRPHNVEPLTFPHVLASDFPNVWLGASASTQADLENVGPDLLNTPAALHFLSLEPLVGPIDLQRFTRHSHPARPVVDWVIVGGESGPNARPCSVEWVRSIVAQCRAAGVPVFVKQLGARPIEPIEADTHDGRVVRGTRWLSLSDRKGGDPSEWPEDLRVREFPG